MLRQDSGTYNLCLLGKKEEKSKLQANSFGNREKEELKTKKKERKKKPTNVQKVFFKLT